MKDVGLGRTFILKPSRGELHVWEAIKHGLADLVQVHLGLPLLDKKQQDSDWTADQLSPQQLEYAAIDAKILLDLYPKLRDKISDQKLEETFNREIGCLPAAVEMETTGIMVDLDKLNLYQTDCQQKVDVSKSRITQY